MLVLSYALWPRLRAVGWTGARGRRGAGIESVTVANRGRDLSNARRLVDMSSSPPAPALPPLPPADELGFPEEHIAPITSPGSVPRQQVVTRHTRSIVTGRIVDFAVALQESDPQTARWRDLVKIDTSHREVHWHDNRGYGKTQISIPEDCTTNIDRAYEWAQREIWGIASPAPGEPTLWDHDG